MSGVFMYCRQYGEMLPVFNDNNVYIGSLPVNFVTMFPPIMGVIVFATGALLQIKENEELDDE